MKRFVKIVLDTGYVGTREEIYAKTDMTDNQLNSYVNDMAIEHAEQYNYMVYGGIDIDVETYAEDCGISVEDAEAEMDEFYEGACADSYWEEITEEEAEEAVENGYKTIIINN